MSVETRKLATLLGFTPKKAQTINSLDLAEAVNHGLPVDVVELISKLIAPDDSTMRNRIVPKATLMRRQRAPGRRLSSEESGRVARLARLWAFALDVWGSPEAARRFLSEPHPLLRNRVPRELAIETEIGAREVENLLGRLKYGSAV
jgi:putative toxin-antitoxin system antitoxin component (TIGR02293 family)